jgi:autotransporter-associated beta strand protein
MKPTDLSNPLTSRSSLLASALFLAFATPAAMAATGTWAAANLGAGNWSDAAKWTGSIPTAAGDTANFNANYGTDNKTVTIDGGNRSVGIMTFGDPSANYWVVTVNATGGGTLTFDNGASAATLSKSAANNPVIDVISAPVILNSNLIVTNSSLGDGNGNSLAITGAITGNGSITKNGVGGFQLSSNSNTFAGGFTLNEGEIHLFGSLAFGSGTLTINGGTIIPRGAARNVPNAVTVGGNFSLGQVPLNSQMQLSGAMDLGGATRTITVPDTTVVVDAIISGGMSNGGFTKDGAGTLQVGGTNTYSGPTTLSAGVMNLTGTLSDSSVSVATGTTLTQSNTGAIGGVGVTFTSAGTATLGGTNTYTGATSVTGGTLTTTALNPFDASSSVSVNGASAKLVAASQGTIVPPVTVTQGSVEGDATFNTLTVADSSANHVTPGVNNGSSMVVQSMTFQGAASLDIRATGTLSDQYLFATDLVTNPATDIIVNLTNTSGSWTSGVDYPVIDFSTYTSAGDASHFILGTMPNLNPTQTATLVNTGGEIVVRVTGSALTWTGLQNSDWTTTPVGGSRNWVNQGNPIEFTNGSAVVFNDSTAVFSVNLASNVSPSTTVVQNTGSNDYTFSSSNGSGIQGGALTKSGDARLTLNTVNGYTGATTINGGILEISGTGSITSSASIVNDAQLVFSLTGPTNTYSAPISGLGSITKAGTGVLTLSGANTFTGGLVLDEGTLNLNSAGALGTGTATVTVNGGTLNNTSGVDLVLTSSKPQAWNGDFTFAGTNSLDMGSGAVTVGGTGTDRIVTVSGGTLSVGEVKAAALGLIKEGAGTLVFDSTGAGGASSVLSGVLTVNGGTVQFNRTAGADINTTGDLSVAGLAGTGKIVNGSGYERWLFVNTAASTTHTFGGTFENGGTFPLGVIKQGAGTLTLTGAGSTHTGPTRVDAGILVLQNGAALGPNSPLINRNRAGAIHLEGNITVPNNLTLSNDGTTAGTPGYAISNISGDNTLSGNVSLIDGGGHTVIRSVAGSLAITGPVTNVFTTGRNLILGGASTGANTVSNVISNGTAVNATTGVEKVDAGTWTLSGANTYTGSTTVTAGTLSITQPTLSDTSAVVIGTTGAVLNLAHSSTDQVGSLTINGQPPKANGVYDATTDPGFITGPGKIRVGPAAGYATWAAGFPFTVGVNDGPEQDADFDGINNVLEYVLGGIPVGAGSMNMSILPTQALDTNDLILTFHRSDLSETDAVVKVQWSSNLSTWNDFATLTAASELPKVQITEDSPSAAVDTVVVRIPRSNAPGLPLFGRIVATKN